MRSRLLLVALAAPLLLAPPAGADTSSYTDYAVVIEGSADYNRADVDGEVSAQHDVAIDFRTQIPKLRFHGRFADKSSVGMSTASVRRGSYTLTGPTATLRCAGHTLADSTGGGLDANVGEGKTIFAARVIDAFTVQIGGCPPMPAWQMAVGSDGDPVGVGIFDGSFSFPDDRIGEASMTFPLKGSVTGAGCPFNHFNTVLCSLTWDATVTFTRIGEGEEDIDVPNVPIVPPAPAPAPPAEEDDLLVPRVAKAALAPSLRAASLPFTCAADCRGTVTALARGERLARRTFSAEAGARARATLRFDAADRRAIRRAGGVRLVLKARVAGVTAPVTRSVTLRAR